MGLGFKARGKRFEIKVQGLLLRVLNVCVGHRKAGSVRGGARSQLRFGFGILGFKV